MHGRALLTSLSALVVLGMVGPGPAVGAPTAERPALSGTVTGYGHTVAWNLGGVKPLTAEMEAMGFGSTVAGYAYAGSVITFSGTLTYVHPGGMTYLDQRAWIGGNPTDEAKYTGGTLGNPTTITTPYNLRFPKSKTSIRQASGAVDLPAGLTQVDTVYYSAYSRNCGDNVCSPYVQAEGAIVIFANPGGTSPTSPKPSAAPTAPTNDTTPPVVTMEQFTKIVPMAYSKYKKYRNTAKYPFDLHFRATDDSGMVAVHVDVYADNQRVGGGSTHSLSKATKYGYTVKKRPPGKGPFYACAWAEDAAGNTSPEKGACTWLSIEVPLSDWGNGCGSDGVAEGYWGQLALWAQNLLGNTRNYGGYTVDVSPACNVHDAGYAGVTVFDPVAMGFVDFRTWSRSQVDSLFAKDIQRICAKKLNSAKARKYLDTCQNGLTLAQADAKFAEYGLQTDASGQPTGDALTAWNLVSPQLGAHTYYDIVRTYGAVGFDADLSANGTQSQAPGAPVLPAGGERIND